MPRAMRVLRAVARAVGWFVVGWMACFGMALYGSKLHSMATRSGISLDKRARMAAEDDRFDWMPEHEDMRSKD